MPTETALTVPVRGWRLARMSLLSLDQLMASARAT
ncbi:hypothetical protein SHIRM173S_05310 [Streptomyces hirsutus]